MSRLRDPQLEKGKKNLYIKKILGGGGGAASAYASTSPACANDAACNHAARQTEQTPHNNGMVIVYLTQYIKIHISIYYITNII